MQIDKKNTWRSTPWRQRSGGNHELACGRSSTNKQCRQYCTHDQLPVVSLFGIGAFARGFQVRMRPSAFFLLGTMEWYCWPGLHRRSREGTDFSRSIRWGHMETTTWKGWTCPEDPTASSILRHMHPITVSGKQKMVFWPASKQERINFFLEFGTWASPWPRTLRG